MLGLLLAAASSLCSPDSPGPDSSTYAEKHDPYVVRDAAKRFELDVDPSRPRADRPCRVAARSGGADLWSAEFPCVWRDAAITADGTSVGWGIETSEPAAGDALRARVHLWIVAPDGKPRGSTSWECVTKGGMVGYDPPPRVLGTVLDAVNDRWLVRVYMPWNTVEWRWYRLSTGALYATHVVAELAETQRASIRRIEEQAPVAGTNWVLSRRATLRYGERAVWTDDFELVDEKGAAWWTIAAERSAGEAAIVRCDEPRRFDVTFGPEAPVRRFEIVPDAKTTIGAAVRELEALAPPTPAPEVALAQCRFEVIARRPLQAAASTGAWLGADAVAFDDRLRVGLLVDPPTKPLQFVLAAKDGTELVRFDVSEELEGYESQLEWIGGDRWIATCATADLDHKAVWIDAAERHVGPVTQLEGVEVVQLRRTPGGGFAANVYDRVPKVLVFDAAGEPAWSVESREDLEFMAAALAIDVRGRTALLGGSANQHLYVLDDHGRRTESIDLAALFGGEDSYDAVCAHPDGGWLVTGYGRSDSVRVGARNEHGPSFAPKRVGGEAMPRSGELPVRAPDGSLWWHEGAALVALDAIGTVRGTDAVLEGGDLHACGAATFDDAGRLYVVDAQSQRVHVYDAQGRRISAIGPAPRFANGAQGVERIRVAPSGRVFAYALDESGEVGAWVELDAGTVRAVEQFVPDASARDVSFVRGGNDAWCLLSNEDFLVVARRSAAGKVLARVDRSPDRAWFEGPMEIAALPDGGLLVADGRGFHAYRPDGTARSSVAASQFVEYLGGSARRWVAGSGRGLVVTDLLESGPRVREGEIPVAADFQDAIAHVAPDGSIHVFVPSLREILVLRPAE